MFFQRKKTDMPNQASALPGRATAIPTAKAHFINGNPLEGPYPVGSQRAMFGLGCFWGAERKFWELGAGIYITAVGYAGGLTPNPTYDEVCSGLTGHNEVVLAVFDPAVLGYAELVKTFFESHNPTQGMRQGNDVGTQYRSGIYPTDAAQRMTAEAALLAYGRVLSSNGFGPITSEIVNNPPFYFAEDYHQQYLAKVPNGYCGLGGTGLSCPVGTGHTT